MIVTKEGKTAMQMKQIKTLIEEATHNSIYNQRMCFMATTNAH